MVREATAVLVAVTLLVVPLVQATSLDAGSGSPPALAEHGRPTAPSMSALVERSLDRQTGAGEETFPGAMAGLADQALAFAGQPGVQAGDPGATLDALEPLLDAHREATSQLWPGLGEGLAPSTSGLDRARSVVDRIPQPDGGSLGEGGPWEALPATAGAGLDSGLGWTKATPALAGPPQALALESPAFDTLPEAVDVLFELEGYAPPADERARIDRLDDLPPRVAEPLTRIVEAYILQTRATERAFEDGWQATASPTSDAAEHDRRLLDQARSLVAARILTASDDLSKAPCQDGFTETSSPLFQYDLSCKDTRYEEETALLVDLGGNDTYQNNAGGGGGASDSDPRAALLVDQAGRDTYSPVDQRDASRDQVGLNGGAFEGSGFLFDRAGNDTYSSTLEVAAPTDPGSKPVIQAGVNGGGHRGSGGLVDLAGNDTYLVHLDTAGTGAIDGNATAAVNGGAWLGSGALFDGTGNDTYRVLLDRSDTLSAGVNGGAFEGQGFLADGSGNDTYAVVSPPGTTERAFVGANGGGYLGSGTLTDGTGNDTYRVELEAIEQLSVGANGGGEIGTGRLVDGAGNDTYTATVTTQGNRNLSHVRAALNGGGGLGTGILVDADGNDTYEATLTGGQGPFSAVLAGVNGGAELGLGALVDGAGNDTYTSHLVGRGTGWGSEIFAGANGGATSLGVGLLVDRAGNNSYRGTVDSLAETFTAINGAASGFGLFHLQRTVQAPSLDGVDIRFHAQTVVDAPTVPVAGGLGILLGSTGNDTYESQGTSQGASDPYGVGLLVDPGGNNTYRAQPGPDGTGLAQGAGAHGGLGVLLDAGPNATLHLGGGVAGQGAGIQGDGLVLRPDPTGRTNYTGDPGSQPSLVEGTGVGMRIDRGTVDGFRPDTSCANDPVETTSPTVAGTTTSVALCPPNPETKETIINPITAKPVTVEDPRDGSGSEGTIWKPSAPCDATIVELGCQLVSLTINEETQNWLERDNVTSTTSGGILYWSGREESGELLRQQSRTTVPMPDETCSYSCSEVF